MSEIFHFNHQKLYQLKKENREDFLLTLQFTVALIALAVLFFLR